MRLRAWCAVALVVLVGAGCQRSSPPAGKPLVVVTFYPVYEFTRQVAGDRAEVVSLVPPGVEPHDWEPSPQDVVQAQRARLFVYNGAGFEPWAGRLLTDIAGKSTLAVETTKGLDLLRAASQAIDPHVWLDPVLAQSQVEAIRAGLEQADPPNRAVYAEHARAFVSRLRALDEAFAAGLGNCARREVVTSHAAFGYLTRRYRLTQISVAGLAPESEPSPADLAAIVDIGRRLRVKYVFFETLVSPRLAETLARELGAKTLVLNPIEGLTKEEAAAGKGYLDLMRTNLESLRIGLDCT